MINTFTSWIALVLMILAFALVCVIGFVPYALGMIWEIISSGFGAGRETNSIIWTALKAEASFTKEPTQ